MRLQPATILNAVLLVKYVHAAPTATSYEGVHDVQKQPSFTEDNRVDAKRFSRALVGVNEARTVNLARQSSELKEALTNAIDPVMSVVNNVNVLKNLAPDLSMEAKASEIPFPVGIKDKVHKALLLLSGNTNYLEAVADKPQLLRKYLNLLETESDHSSPAVVEAMNAIRSDWDKYKKLLDHLNLKKQSTVLTEWLGEKSITANMFKVLTSDVKEEDLYNGKLLAAFDTYVGVYNSKHPTERLSLLAALTVCFGDFRVAQMIDTAKSIPTSKEAAKLAKDLDTRQIKYWVDAHKTPDEVARLLRIGSPLLDASEMAMIGRWLKFIKELSKHEKATSLYPIKILQRLYSHPFLNFDARMIKFLTSESDLDEDSAELLKACLMRYWFNNLKTPDQLETLFESGSFKFLDRKSNIHASLLKRYTKLYNKFGSPLEDSFYSGLKPKDEKWYNSAFAELNTIVSKNNENQPVEKLSLFAALTLRYGDREASTIIDSAMKVEETMKVAKVLEAKQIQSWIDTGKTPDQVFELLDFKSMSLGYKWVKFCNSFSVRHAELAFDPLEKLSKHFSDDVLAMFVVMATSEKLDHAKRYLEMLVWRWFEEMKTPEELEAQLNQNENKKRFFVRLLRTYSDFHMNLGSSSSSKVTIARDEVNVLTSSTKDTNLYDGRVLAAVEAYVRVYNEANPNEPLSLLAALIARLGYKDASREIEAAIASPDLAKIAKQLETEQIQFWVDSGRTPDQVTKLLDFESKSPASVYKWIEFYDRFNLRYPNSAFDPLKSLRNHFSDDELALFVVQATPINLANAKRLENLLVWHWFEEMKTPKEVEALLNRNEKKDLLVALLQTYSEFHKNLGPAAALEILLLGRYKRAITSDMLHVLSPTNVRLNLYDGSVLAAIDAYIRLYNEANPREPLSLLAALTARLGHRDASIVIEAATTIPDFAKIAKQLENEQMQFWVDAGMTPKKVVELLDPKSQRLAMFHRYIKFLNVYSKRPFKSLFDPLKPLRDHFSDIELATFAVEGVENEKDAAERLQAMLLRYWFNNMKPYEEVVKLLHLDGENPPDFKKLLETYENYQRYGGRPSKQGMITRTYKDEDIANGRVFSVYKSNTATYNKNNPMDHMSLIAVLTTCLGDKEAAHAIEAAKHDRDFEKLAKQVQRNQIQLWVENKKAPGDVLKWLITDETRVLHPQIITWLRYVDEFQRANIEIVPIYSILVNQFGKSVVDREIFAPNLGTFWEDVAKLLRSGTWQNTKNAIVAKIKSYAQVVTDWKLSAYLKHIYDKSDSNSHQFMTHSARKKRAARGT